jgi:hypothetical protein
MAFVTDLGATSCLADALDANAVLSVVQDSRPDLIVDLCTELRGGGAPMWFVKLRGDIRRHKVNRPAASQIERRSGVGRER